MPFFKPVLDQSKAATYQEYLDRCWKIVGLVDRLQGYDGSVARPEGEISTYRQVIGDYRQDLETEQLSQVQQDALDKLMRAIPLPNYLHSAVIEKALTIAKYPQLDETNSKSDESDELDEGAAAGPGNRRR